MAGDETGQRRGEGSDGRSEWRGGEVEAEKDADDGVRAAQAGVSAQDQTVTPSSTTADMDRIKRRSPPFRAVAHGTRGTTSRRRGGPDGTCGGATAPGRGTWSTTGRWWSRLAQGAAGAPAGQAVRADVALMTAHGSSPCVEAISASRSRFRRSARRDARVHWARPSRHGTGRGD